MAINIRNRAFSEACTARNKYRLEERYNKINSLCTICTACAFLPQRVYAQFGEIRTEYKRVDLKNAKYSIYWQAMHRNNESIRDFNAVVSIMKLPPSTFCFVYSHDPDSNG